ncbi:hypothetical protein SUDANB95_07154 [Actinosynnema sp. ALI-1.44]
MAFAVTVLVVVVLRVARRPTRGTELSDVEREPVVIATRQVERDDVKLLNERYAKAAEQLGHDGGAYTAVGEFAGALRTAKEAGDLRQTGFDEP